MINATAKSGRQQTISIFLLAVIIVAGQFLVLLAPLPTVASARALIPLFMLCFVGLSGSLLSAFSVNKKHLSLIVFLVFWLFASVFFAESNMAVALSRVTELVICLLFSYSLYVAVSTGSVSVRTILLFVALSFLPILGLLIITWTSLTSPRLHNWTWDIAPFFNIRHIGFSLVPAWIAGNYFLLTSEKKFPWWVFLFMLLAVAVWSGGRGQVVAMGLGSAALAVFLPAYRPKFAKILLFVLPGSVIAAAFFAVRQSGLGLWRGPGLEGGDGGADRFTTGRWSTWTEMIQSCLERLPFCHGPDGYRFVTSVRLETVHPHNWIVQLFSEWGLVGFLIAIGLVTLGVKGLFSLWRGRDGLHGETMVTCVTAWGVYLVYGLVDGVLYHAYPLAMFSVLTTLLLFHLSRRQRIANDGARVSVSAAKRPLFAGITLGAPALILSLHLAVVYADQGGEPPPGPGSIQASIVRAFPSSTFAVDSWVEYWWYKEYPVAREWNQWLIQNGPYPWRPWRAYLREARWLEDNGNLSAALVNYRNALHYVPGTSRDTLVVLRAKVKILERKLARNPAEGTGPPR